MKRSCSQFMSMVKYQSFDTKFMSFLTVNL